MQTQVQERVHDGMAVSNPDCDDAWQSKMQQIEEIVQRSGVAGIRARWESGREMLARKKGKQLPRGLAATLGVQRSELTARMKFATECGTEDECADVISKFKTLFAITHKALRDSDAVVDDALTDKKGPRRTTKPRSSPLRRAIAALDTVGPPSEFTDDDRADLKALVEKVSQLARSVRLGASVAA